MRPPLAAQASPAHRWHDRALWWLTLGAAAFAVFATLQDGAPPAAALVVAPPPAVVTVAASALAAAPAPAAPGTVAVVGTAASAIDRSVPHRPLRTHVEPPPPVATEPLRFEGYPTAPPFTVVPRKAHLALYPCTTCHAALPVNPTPRKLAAAPHAADLQHGKGRMWCLNCHNPTDRSTLISVRGEKIDFNRSDQLCGQCHGDRHRDWQHGGHGKRVAYWRGERELYACTHCHDPHNPVLQARGAQSPPPLRAGLSLRFPPLHAQPPAAKQP
jgi:hypothetical protein